MGGLVDATRDLQPVLENLPIGQFDLDVRLLADAGVFLPEPGNPWAMVNRHVGVLERADSIQAVLPLTGLHAYEVIHDRVVHAGTYGEVIACPEVVRTLTTDPDFVETTNAMAATGRYRLLEVTDRPPYFLGLLDDVVQLGVDEDGEPRGLVESTDPGVQNWTEGVYERFKQQATRVDLSEAEAGPDEPTAE